MKTKLGVLRTLSRSTARPHVRLMSTQFADPSSNVYQFSRYKPPQAMAAGDDEDIEEGQKPTVGVGASVAMNADDKDEDIKDADA